MKTLRLDTREIGLGFAAAHKLAIAIAEQMLDGAMLLSFYDRERNLESPNGVSECHRDCAIPGWQDYAANRGGSLMMDFDAGRYVFCFLGELK